jgi:hypothetical protein
MSVELTPENNYTIGGEIYNLPRNDAYKVSRATRLAKENEYPVEVHRRQHRQPVGVQGGGRRRWRNTWIIRTCPPEVMRSSA